MYKLIVFSALIAFALAGVVPKPPATQNEKEESPSVKGVPLHQSAQNQKAAEKAETKQVEKSKPQEKSSKKDEPLPAPIKKEEQKSGSQKNVKQDSQVKALPKQQPASPAKDEHKGQSVKTTKDDSKPQGQ